MSDEVVLRGKTIRFLIPVLYQYIQEIAVQTSLGRNPYSHRPFNPNDEYVYTGLLDELLAAAGAIGDKIEDALEQQYGTLENPYPVVKIRGKMINWLLPVIYKEMQRRAKIDNENDQIEWQNDVSLYNFLLEEMIHACNTTNEQLELDYGPIEES